MISQEFAVIHKHYRKSNKGGNSNGGARALVIWCIEERLRRQVNYVIPSGLEPNLQAYDDACAAIVEMAKKLERD